MCADVERPRVGLDLFNRVENIRGPMVAEYRENLTGSLLVHAASLLSVV